MGTSMGWMGWPAMLAGVRISDLSCGHVGVQVVLGLVQNRLQAQAMAAAVVKHALGAVSGPQAKERHADRGKHRDPARPAIGLAWVYDTDAPVLARGGVA